MAKTPPSTAFQPPNSSISFTVPFSTFLLAPKVFISLASLALFSTVAFKSNSFLANVFKSASSSGSLYVWFADGSLSVVAPSVLKAFSLFRAFPFLSSLVPEFAIELDSVTFSVFSAFLPTVGFPFVVSTSGVSFFSVGFVFSCVVAVASLACAFVNSACVFALFKTVLASSKTAFNRFTLSSFLESYFPLLNFPSISSINFVNDVLSRVSFSVAFSFEATALATSFLVVSFATGCSVATGAPTTPSEILEFVVFSDVVLFDTSSLACATAPAPKKILAPITTDAVPTLNFFIEYDSTFVPSFVFFK